MPITGSSSPELGIGRLIMGSGLLEDAVAPVFQYLGLRSSLQRLTGQFAELPAVVRRKLPQVPEAPAVGGLADRSVSIAALFQQFLSAAS